MSIRMGCPVYLFAGHGMAGKNVSGIACCCVRGKKLFSLLTDFFLRAANVRHQLALMQYGRQSLYPFHDAKDRRGEHDATALLGGSERILRNGINRT